MSVIEKLVTTATKKALAQSLGNQTILKKVISTTGALIAGETAEKVVQKTGIIQEDGSLLIVLKLPFMKSSEEQLKTALAEHPERKKLFFQYPSSVTAGIKFHDEEANVEYEIHESQKNLKNLELFKDGCLVGKIEKKLTINLNPLADTQRYSAWVHGVDGFVTVNYSHSSIDTNTWKMKQKMNGTYVVEDENGNEIGKSYSLGNSNFILDYDETVDPAELLLTYMAYRIRQEETAKS